MWPRCTPIEALLFVQLWELVDAVLCNCTFPTASKLCSSIKPAMLEFPLCSAIAASCRKKEVTVSLTTYSSWHILLYPSVCFVYRWSYIIIFMYKCVYCCALWGLNKCQLIWAWTHTYTSWVSQSGFGCWSWPWKGRGEARWCVGEVFVLFFYCLCQ